MSLTKKLSSQQRRAFQALAYHGPLTTGDLFDDAPSRSLLRSLAALARKGRAVTRSLRGGVMAFYAVSPRYRPAVGDEGVVKNFDLRNARCRIVAASANSLTVVLTEDAKELVWGGYVRRLAGERLRVKQFEFLPFTKRKA